MDKLTNSKDRYRFSRLMYIFEAAFEYFITILVSGAYLAKVAISIGISDSLTGVLSSFISLGSLFQLIAIFLARKTPVKRWVTVLCVLNQSFFGLIYFVPFFKGSLILKTVLLIVFILLGNVIKSVEFSPKMNWFMSLVDDHKRGTFTAKKEIVSLFGGLLFSVGASYVIDYYEEIGQINVAFVICGAVIFILMLLHTTTLLLSKEKEDKSDHTVKQSDYLRELFKNKNLFKVIIIFILWYVAGNATSPFYGTYEIKELGFSMTFVSVLTLLYTIFRAAFSRPFGRFADKYSFINMVTVCLIVNLASLIVNVFTVPSNGKIMFSVYNILNAISMAGINNGSVNLIYECVDKESRVSALALQFAFCGVAGFVSTLLTSFLVEHIQQNGNTFLGINIFAQQVVSLIGAVIVAGILVYIVIVFKPRLTGKKTSDKSDS